MRGFLKNNKGEGFIDVCVLVLAVALVLALVIRVAPVFVAKQNLDVFADELARTAEIAGCVGHPQPRRPTPCAGKPGLTPLFPGAGREISSLGRR